MLFFICFSASPAWAGWWPFGDDGQDYRIVIEGVDEPTLQWFKKLKLDDKDEQHPPKNMDDLEQESVTLEQRIHLALKSHGYYKAQINMDVEKNTDLPTLRYQIEPGPRAQISEVILEWKDEALPGVSTAQLKLQAGEGVDADQINQDAITLRNAIGKDACLLSLEVKPVLRLDPATDRAALVYRISHGPRANFGEMRLTGNMRTRPDAVRRMLTWKQGECFTQSKVEATQSALFSSQLFSSVEIVPMPEANEKGQVPMEIAVREREAHTVRTGANYATDTGFGVVLGWEDRNFRGGAEKVKADAALAQQEQSLILTQRVPGFWRDDQTLNLAQGIKHEDTDAYTSDALNVSAGLERPLAKSLTGGLGIGYDLKRTDDLRSGEETFSLLSLPGFLQYDTRDNATDARKGIYARANMTPYEDMIDPSLYFLKSTVTGQTYLSSDDLLWKPTLALRGSLGSIAGSPYSKLPADLRYYAGGGGSVRGYSYQALSPRFNGEPSGGGSLLELSAETRLRFTETIGGVAFLDAGNAYTSSFPGGGKLFYGAGLGVRYYSAIGPIRFDVGVPLNGGEVEKDAYQLYVSLGQAF